MKKTTINTALVLFSMLIALLLLEFSLRLIGNEKLRVYKPNPERAIFWQFDNLLGWKHLPGKDGKFILGETAIPVKINSSGLRDRFYPYERTDGFFRIVVLGDSFTWGFGVEQDQIFSELIEKTNNKMELINMGVSGYSTDQEYLLLQNEGLKYLPDLVILMFFNNDVYENTLDINYIIYPKPKFSLIDGKLILTKRPQPKISLVRRIHYFLRTHLITYDSLVRVYLYSDSSLFTFFRDLVKRTANLFSSKNSENDLKLTFAIFDEIKTLCETNGAKFMIVNVATHKQALNFDAGKPSPLAKFCVSKDIPFLDLAGPFQDYLKSHKEISLQLPNDRHWNAKAHHLAADIITSFLLDKQLIPAEELK